MMLDSVIERLNLWADHLARIAWPLFWQSSLLIVAMFLLDLFLRRKLRPSVRHALWLVVLVKLLIPPSLASPTGMGWWLRPRQVAPAKQPVSYVVTYGAFQEPPGSQRQQAPSSFPVPPLPVRLSTLASTLVASGATSLVLLTFMLMRWRRLQLQMRKSQAAPVWLLEIARDTQRLARCRRPVRLMLTDSSISPALCGLFRPLIVLPIKIVERLTPSQLRAVLLHELFHLRNGDVWINCVQSLLQIVFWWHPLLWLANARIRRIREEVTDDAVRLALGEEAETYAPTLLEVARLALVRPLATLGFVGILESRHALRQRVDRLVNFPAPRRAGLSIVSTVVILAFASVALPMGQAPPKLIKSIRTSNSNTVLTDKGKAAEAEKLGWDIQPINENGWVEYDLASGIGTATNGAVVTRGNSVISADKITLNQQTGELVANGSVEIQSGAAHPAVEIEPVSKNDWIKYDAAAGTATATNGGVLRQGDRVVRADNITFDRETGKVVAAGHYDSKSASGNATNLQLAQVQPSGINPSRVIQTSSGRRRILNKLEAIRLNHVSFDNLPLSEVVNYLRDEAKKRDPEGKGINFLINPNADTPPPGAIDPATGLPVSAPQVEPADINSVTIRIVPSLNDVRMIDVLDAITKVADKRIRYAIEDYGISFRLGGNVGPALFSRVIKVDPNVFSQGLESVVGVSVGNFQTGGQGGGGQQGNSSVTVPRVQVAPNGIGGQGAQGGAQGGVGGISGVTRPTTAITPQAIRQFFVNAGVDLTPPKSFFYTVGEGALQVHGTMADIDAIEKALGSLSTSSTQPTTAVKSEMPSKPISSQTNETKVPVLGDLPVAGSLFQVRTAQVLAANSPQQMTNIPSAGTGEKLLTRAFKIDPRTFLESLKKAGNLADNASPQDVINAFRKILLEGGLELQPPKNIFYNEHGASLLVRATAQDLEFIESFIQVLNLAPPQINIRAKFVELSEADAKLAFSSLKEFPSSNSGSSTTTNSTVGLAEVLSDPQFRVILHALEQRDTVDLRSESSVTTLSGRQAQVQNIDVQSVVSLNRQAFTSPGVTSSNLLQTTPISSGPVLDIIPVVKSDGMTVSLEATATVTEFLGYDQPPKGDSTFVYVDGKAQSITPPLPHIRVRSLHNSAKLYDGQTLMLGMPSDVTITYDKDGKATTHPNGTRKELLVFLTATIIDPAGNPIRTGDPLLLVPDQR